MFHTLGCFKEQLEENILVCLNYMTFYNNRFADCHEQSMAKFNYIPQTP